MISNARHDFGEIPLRVETIWFRRTDQAINDRGTLTARIQPSKETILPAQSDRLNAVQTATTGCLRPECDS